MTKHRHGISAVVALLLGFAAVGLVPDAAIAQRNCQPWLTGAQQEAARGNTRMAAEGMRIYEECVRQARAAAAKAGSTYGRNLHWIGPEYYGVVMDSVANPAGSRVVRIPGYKPNPIPGRPPGPIGGKYPGSPGQSGGSSACPGGCPPGTGTGVQHKSFQRSAYGRGGAAGYAGRDALATRAGARPALGARSPYTARSPYAARMQSARQPSYAARSPYAARSARGAGAGSFQYWPPQRRGLR